MNNLSFVTFNWNFHDQMNKWTKPSTIYSKTGTLYSKRNRITTPIAKKKKKFQRISKCSFAPCSFTPIVTLNEKHRQCKKPQKCHNTFGTICHFFVMSEKGKVQQNTISHINLLQSKFFITHADKLFLQTVFTLRRCHWPNEFQEMIK